jgi:hypothetical protein
MLRIEESAFEEMLEDHLRALVVRRVGSGDAATGAGRTSENPYRGLRSFDLENVAFFSAAPASATSSARQRGHGFASLRRARPRNVAGGDLSRRAHLW